MSGRRDRHGRDHVYLGYDVTPAELIALCADKLAKFRVPGEIVFQQSLPKTSVGKIQKHLIHEALLASR